MKIAKNLYFRTFQNNLNNNVNDVLLCNILNAAIRILATEAVAWRCSIKKVFLKILQNS